MTLTSVRASNSIGLEIDCVISISRKKGGSICNKAMTVDLSKLDTAIDCFNTSWNLRGVGGRDRGFDHMFLNLNVCVTELEACTNTRISSREVAATQVQALLEHRTPA
jgi:hypothetical protein